MLSEMKSYEKANANFVVIDIENWPDGRLICVHTAWRVDDKTIKVVKHETWRAWIAWLLTRTHDRRFKKIFAHNGGGWDFVSLVEHLLTGEWEEKADVEAMFAASSMVAMKVKFKTGNKESVTVQFCDSLQLLRSSLDKLSKTFLGVGKVETGGLLPHEIYARNRQRFYDYCRCDVEHLLRILEIALSTIRENVAEIPDFGITIGATAMQVFRTIGGFGSLGMPEDEHVKEKLRLAYTGGRVETFKYGYAKHAFVYDVNSLYPYSMLTTNVPLDGNAVRTTKFQGGEVPGIYRIEYEQSSHKLPAALCSMGAGSYAGVGWYFSPEIERLFAIGGRARILEGYYFPSYGKPFDTYIKRLYKLRQSGNESLSLLCKFLLNSLYGKFGQRPEREMLIRLNESEVAILVSEGERIRPIRNDGDTDVYSWIQERDCKHEHVGIAGMITSRSRVVLHEGLCDASNNGELLYCDTDSVHCTGLFGGSVGNEIGQFKLEFEGEAVYAGKKLYGLRNNTTEKIRCKGVSLGGRNGASVDFNDLISLCGGAVIQCTFKKPATSRAVMSGRSIACRFETRKRRIRMTTNGGRK